MQLPVTTSVNHVFLFFPWKGRFLWLLNMENGASEAVKAGNVEESPQQLASGPAVSTAAAAPPRTILVRKPPGHRFPNNPTNLVAPDTILTSEQILAEKMNLTDLHNAVPDKVLAGFQWCARRRYIRAFPFIRLR